MYIVPKSLLRFFDTEFKMSIQEMYDAYNLSPADVSRSFRKEELHQSAGSYSPLGLLFFCSGREGVLHSTNKWYFEPGYFIILFSLFKVELKDCLSGVPSSSSQR